MMKLNEATNIRLSIGPHPNVNFKAISRKGEIIISPKSTKDASILVDYPNSYINKWYQSIGEYLSRKIGISIIPKELLGKFTFVYTVDINTLLNSKL